MWKNWWKRLSGANAETGASASADETEYVRPATWEDLLKVVSLLNAHQVDYVLVGGYALGAHGLVRMTEDIDVAVDPDPQNSQRWILALSQLPDGATREMIGETDPFEGDLEHAIRINDEITVDVMPSVCGIDFHALKSMSEPLEIGATVVPVLSLEGLLQTKQGLRDKDKADAWLLRQALKQLQDDEGDDENGSPGPR